MKHLKVFIDSGNLLEKKLDKKQSPIQIIPLPPFPCSLVNEWHEIAHDCTTRIIFHLGM